MKHLIWMQRPAPSERAGTIGAWMTVLELLSLASVATNMGVFCFTSSHLRDAFGMDESQRVWCFILLEHTAVFIQLLMRHAIADVPEWVLQHRARDKYQLSLREHVIF